MAWSHEISIILSSLPDGWTVFPDSHRLHLHDYIRDTVHPPIDLLLSEFELVSILCLSVYLFLRPAYNDRNHP